MENRESIKKIFAIVGESGSGKSTLVKTLCEIHNDLELLIPSTSRPKRDSEIDGVDYHFLTLEQFENSRDKDDFISWTTFRGWGYGLSRETVLNSKSDNLIIVTNPYELLQMLQEVSHKEYVIIPIYIYTCERTRLLRSLERNDDIDEVIRRLKTDRDDFLHIPYTVLRNNGHIIKNDGKFLDAVEKLFYHIKSTIGECYE